MATSRSFGGRLLTTRPPILISPAVMFSSPAIIRRSVDLPHPDGPTSTTNSPSPMATLTPWMTSTVPKAFRTSRIATGAIQSSRSVAALARPAPSLRPDHRSSRDTRHLAHRALVRDHLTVVGQASRRQQHHLPAQLGDGLYRR